MSPDDRFHCTSTSKCSHLILISVGLRPYTPHRLDGIRILPPISLPKPNTDPPPAISEPSPPDDPPTPRVVSWGFLVTPNTGFVVSQLKTKINLLVYTWWNKIQNNLILDVKILNMNTCIVEIIKLIKTIRFNVSVEIRSLY
jgi:hypothetical protein